MSRLRLAFDPSRPGVSLSPTSVWSLSDVPWDEEEDDDSDEEDWDDDEDDDEEDEPEWIVS